MISKLVINNFVIIEYLEIDFSEGLNVVVGASGSGKSLVATALMFLFGGKIASDFVREGTNKAIIEGSFLFTTKADCIFNFLTDADITCDSDEIIIRREITLKGNSRCFINDTPVTISTLKNFCYNIFDLHSQNEEQRIVEKSEQLKIIDCMLDNKFLLTDYKVAESNLKDLTAEYNSLMSNKNNSIEKNEILTKLLNEIIEINPTEDEDNKIIAELSILENAEELILIVNNFLDTLDNEDCSAINRLNETAKHLTKLTDIDNIFSLYKTEFDAAIITIKETKQFVNNYKDSIDFSGERIEELRNRFVDIRKLIKKYGSISEALSKKDEYQNELLTIKNYDQSINEINIQITNCKKELSKIANKLTAERTKTANIFSKDLINELAKLGLENTNIKINFSPTAINDIIFLISMNKGESVAPLGDVASGGEISRIMLAIRTILASRDNVPILIFDEIDSGMSGRIGQRVGKCMQTLSKHHQIIVITHLPQTAAMGENIIAIEKNILNDRTTTTATKLDDKGKINEIAKMLSGEKITDAAIKTAKELIKEGMIE